MIDGVKTIVAAEVSERGCWEDEMQMVADRERMKEETRIAAASNTTSEAG